MEGSKTRGRLLVLDPRLVLGLVLVAAVLATSWLAVLLAEQLHATAAWWPAAGIGAVTLLALPRRWWPVLLPALLAAYAAGNLAAGRDLVAAALLGASDLLEAAIVAMLVRRVVGRRLEQVGDYWRLLAITALGSAVATLGVATTAALRLDHDFWTLVLRTLPAHATSMILFLPLALLRPERRRVSRGEVALQVALLAAVTAVTFGPGDHLRLAFAPLPILVWAALRFGALAVAVEQAVFAVAVTAGTWLGWGPFPLEPPDLGPSTSSQLSQLYLLSLLVTGLPLALGVRQRDAAMEQAATSSKVFRHNFTRSKIAIALLEWDGETLRFVESNAAAYAVLGTPSTELSGRRVCEVMTGARLEDAAAGIVADRTTGWTGRVGVSWDPVMVLDATMSPIQRQGADHWLFSLHLVDVTRAVEAHERLREEKDYTRAVSETASSMIVVTTSDGTITAVNRATTELTGFTEGDLLGRKLWENLMSGRNEQTVRRIFEADAELPRSGEALLRTRDGGHLAVMFSNSTYQARPGAPQVYVLTATDVTAARESAGLIEHLLRSATTIAFIGTDLSGRITLFNTGAEQMLGVEADDVVGTGFTDFLAAEDLRRAADRQPGLSGFAAVVEAVAQLRGPDTRDWTFVHAAGRERRVSMTTNPVTDIFGNLIGFLLVARDVTDTRRSQEILVRALRREREVVARLQELDRVKDDFISTVSHELRTPMSSIIGSAEMLADGMVGELTSAQRRLVDVVARNGDRLLMLADDLLLLAAMDSGTLQARHAAVDLGTVARESLNTVSTMIATRDLQLSVDLPVEPVTVLGDGGHLERAVTNLLTNAVKFTPDGGAVSVVVGRDHERRAVVSVSDTGLGISEQELGSVFSRFFRSQTVQDKAIQGSGLGLAIVKGIVEDHGGQIDVRSLPGAGTTFTIRLQPAPEPDAVGSPRRSRPSTRL